MCIMYIRIKLMFKILLVCVQGIGTFLKFLLLRFPGVGASYNDAVTNCQAKSGSLLNVEDIKFIDVNFVKSKAKLSIFRIDAKKGSKLFFLF